MSQVKNGKETPKKRSWDDKDIDMSQRILCEIQYNNEMVENLTRTFHQSTEII